METALKGVPVVALTPPPGVVNSGGEWFYEEYAHNAGVNSLGLDAPLPNSNGNGGTVAAPPPAEERNRILDLFRN